jgi:hypothetical protein
MAENAEECMRRAVGRRTWTYLLSLTCALTACARIAPYSEVAYHYATSLKVESLALVAKATEPYAEHRAEVEKLQLELEKAYEYARSRPDNELSTRQWAILLDPQRALLGGVLARWKSEGMLARAFVDNMKAQIGAAFDTISGLESGKVKPGDVKTSGGP